MKRLSWKYLAGLIDGEGCIDVQVTKVNDKFYVRPRVRINMTVVAEDIINMIANSHGGYVSHRKVTNPNWNDSLCWECVGYKQACMFLRNVTNHLFLKREQARFCLWLETNVKGKQVSAEARDAIRQELKLMKRDSHRLSEKAQENILKLL